MDRIRAEEVSSGVGVASPDDAAFRAKFPKAWLLRQCRVYDEELSACKSVRARLSQYYVDGKIRDCHQWKDNADDCRKWMGERDEEALGRLLGREDARLRARLSGHFENDVWERRTEPPSEAEWTPKLPPHLEDAADLSQLRLHALKMEKKAAGEEVTEKKELGQFIRDFADGYKQNCVVM